MSGSRFASHVRTRADPRAAATYAQRADPYHLPQRGDRHPQPRPRGDRHESGAVSGIASSPFEQTVVVAVLDGSGGRIGLAVGGHHAGNTASVGRSA